MIHTMHRPRAPLDRFIENIWTAEAYHAPSARERILPTGTLAIVIHLADGPMRSYDDATAPEPNASATSIVCGARATPIVIGSGFGPTIGVHFRPGGGRRFFDLPSCEISEQVVDLEALWGRSANVLRERLLCAKTPNERVRLLEDALLARTHDYDLRAALELSLSALDEPSLGSIAEVNDRTGLSPKRLLALFRDEVGLRPKEYWRVRRVRAALRDLETGTYGGAAIAAIHGYFDQAHFLRECRAIIGSTAMEYMLARIPGTDHVAVLGSRSRRHGGQKDPILGV